MKSAELENKKQHINLKQNHWKSTVHILVLDTQILLTVD